MKKFLSIMLIFALLFSFAGCGEKPQGDKTSSSGSSSEKAESGERVIKDLGGKVIRIATSDNYGGYTPGESDLNDARLKYIDDIAKELNCKFEWIPYEGETLTTKLITNSLSGDTFCEIAIPIFWNSAALFTNRVLTDLNAVESVNLSASYWDQATNDLLTVNKIQRAAACGMTCISVQETAAVVFNKRIIKEMGLEDPYKLAESGKWTVEKLREMAKTATKDLDGVSGMTKNDQFGITTLDLHALLQDFYTADGYEIVTKDAGGLFKYNMNSTEFVTRLKFYQDFYSNDNSFFINDDQEAQHAQFRDGKALFYIFQLSYLGKFTEMKDDYGIVPFPLGEGQKEYKGLMNWNTRLMGIPVTVKGDDLYDVGCVLDAFAYHSRNDNDISKQQIIGRYLRDTDAIKYLDVISESGYHAPELFICTPRFPEIQQNTTWIVGGVDDPTYDFAQKISETKNTAISLIASFNSSMGRK